MAVTTYRSFVDALEALSITDVKKQYTQGPPMAQPTNADIPAQYVRYPGSDEVPIVFGEQGGWPTLRADLIVLVKAVGLSTAFENFDATVDMMDNVAAALRNQACTTKSHVRWSLRQIIDTVAGQEYWAVLAQVEGSG
jgi:hypothetical protein